MNGGSNQTPIRLAWINYVKSVQKLLVAQTDDRPVDQFFSFRDTVLDIVQGEIFLIELDKVWYQHKPRSSREAKKAPNPEIIKALLIEIQAFPLAAEIAQATEKPEEKKAWWKRTLGRASTVTGSVKDILDNLPPYPKGGLILFMELIELFKGKE